MYILVFCVGWNWPCGRAPHLFEVRLHLCDKGLVGCFGTLAAPPRRDGLLDFIFLWAGLGSGFGALAGERGQDSGRRGSGKSCRDILLDRSTLVGLRCSIKNYICSTDAYQQLRDANEACHTFFRLPKVITVGAGSIGGNVFYGALSRCIKNKLFF